MITIRPTSGHVVNAKHQIVWQYGLPCRGHWSESSEQSNSAELLENGHVLIADGEQQRVIEVTRDKRSSSSRSAERAGFRLRFANGPYDAKAIGDYTACTPPSIGTLGMPTSLR